MRGYEVCVEFLDENGFDVPILVDRKDGLDLTVPPPTFTIQDVENLVGKVTFMLELVLETYSQHIVHLLNFCGSYMFTTSPNTIGTFIILNLNNLLTSFSF